MSDNNSNGHNSNGHNKDVDMDREVIRCKSCGLVQYRTNSGNCRRCVRLLPPKVEFLIPPPVTRSSPVTTANYSRSGRIARPWKTSATAFASCGNRVG